MRAKRDPARRPSLAKHLPVAIQPAGKPALPREQWWSGAVRAVIAYAKSCRTPVRLLAFATGLFIIGAAAYFVTHERWNFFDSLGFVSFYDEQGRSLLDGRWDVSLDGIRGEAFLVHGKPYAYFGFAPALPRMVLNTLLPAFFGKWGRLSMIAAMASLVAAFFAFLALVKAPVLFEPLLLVILLPGTTAIFLCASNLTYHEAGMWGAALAVWAYLWYAWYLNTGRFVFLALGAITGFGSFFTRMTSGSGTLTCAGLILIALIAKEVSVRGQRIWFFEAAANWLRGQPRHRVAHASFLLLYFSAMALTYLYVNHAKFGTYLDPHPTRYHVQYTPERLARIQGRILHPEYIPMMASKYFNPANIEVRKKFPFVAMKTFSGGFEEKLDGVEGYASVPAAMPAAFALAIAGTVFLFRPEGQSLRWCAPVLIGAASVAPSLLSYVYISYRYQHDWFPYLFPAAILGAVWVSRMQNRAARAAVVSVLALAAIWSVWVNVAFVYELQRQPLFG